MILKGSAVLLGDNINTDFIISGRYKFSITDMKELAKHIMEDIDPEFPKKLRPGESIIVAAHPVSRRRLLSRNLGLSRLSRSLSREFSTVTVLTLDYR